MTYRITGLALGTIDALRHCSDAALAAQGAMRVTADRSPGYPCRVSLTDAAIGETLVLLNHVSHDVTTPYRSAYAIYVREAAEDAAVFEDQLPPVFEGRSLAFRAFDEAGMLRDAALALPGTAEDQIARLFEHPAIAYLHAHNAAHGCFVARVDRA